MKKLLLSALAGSISVVTSRWLGLDLPSAISNTALLGSTTKPHQTPICQGSRSWVTGLRFLQLPMSSWGPDSSFSRLLGKRSAPLPISSWGPDSLYSRVPWQFDVQMPMIHMRGGLNIRGLDRTVFHPWKFRVGQSGRAIYNTKKWGPKSTKEAAEGEEEEVDELGKGSLKAMLPWGMNLQSPMRRGKKSYLPLTFLFLSMRRNMIKNQADSQ